MEHRSRQQVVDELMEKSMWKDYWCQAQTCGCIGCVQIGTHGKVDYEEWLDWKKRHNRDTYGLFN